MRLLGRVAGASVMYLRCTIGAIFFVFILCVHCENGLNNEARKIYVPSAPQNLTANRVSTEEIHLSWAPPTTFTVHNKRITEPQSDSPVQPLNDDSKEKEPHILEESKYQRYNDAQKFNNEYSSSDILSDRYSRELRTHRHRKRRHDVASNVTEGEGQPELPVPVHMPDKHMEIVKKNNVLPHKDPTKIAYVLYFEQGKPTPMSNTQAVYGVPSSDDVRNSNAFPSDLGMIDNSKDYSTKNLTLLNTAGKLTKVVGFRLRNLKPFTPYKIWVRAFYNFSLDGVKSSDLLDHLGPQSDPLYVLTDVRAPSEPIVLNLTCDKEQGVLNVQWRQPILYDNTLDLYVVTLRKIPEQHPRTRLTLPTDKNDIETAISVPAELTNLTRYEVKIYAVTRSVAKRNLQINGTESKPEEISSESCIEHSETILSDGRASNMNNTGTVALLATLPIVVILAIITFAIYWRCRSRLSKCISAAYSYLEEGGERAARAPLNSYKKPINNQGARSPTSAPTAAGEGDSEVPLPPPGGKPPRPPKMAAPQHPALTHTEFVKHVAALHADGDLGFSKEYEIVVSKSAALGHTSHYSHRPENRLKNRYLNITAYDHSRVCVSAGGRCGASGCIGGSTTGSIGSSKNASCDYVNANFIDGILPALDQTRIEYIKKKLERRKKPQRQVSVKPVKPQPILAEGIESAFLNIEFSGIVESEQSDDSSSDRSDDEDNADDVCVEIDGVPTRVKLEWLVWRRRYIATQGPTPATLDAFWQMIYQHKVNTVVMITNLVERGRRKCDMYWPSGGRGSSAQFGNVRVTLLCENVRAAYTVRHLKAQYTGSPGTEGASRTIVQYHYTMWPDHGTPRHPLAVLPFVMSAAEDNDTVLVHCSAGVGRTGTYIVLDAQLNQLKLTGTLSPLGFLCRARTQRNHLVQTEEQYVFVHDALLEHVRSGNTAVDMRETRDYLVKLLQPITDEELAVLEIANKNKSVNDLTNGYEMNDTASVKSQTEKTDTKDDVIDSESVKTDDVSELSKSVKDLNDEEGDKDVKVNGDSEGMYDLAPRSTDTFSKKMAAYNNLGEEEKEEIRRANRAENFAILERMRSLSNRSQQIQGPPPVNLLEKQYQLLTRSCVEPGICARAIHNAEKNRPGGVVPSDAARVMLVPKPGVEGSEYINASWVCGRHRAREYAVCQHPPASARADIWRLLWDHTAQLALMLADDEDCEVFWPTEDEKELFVANFRASFVSKEIYIAHRKSDRTSEPKSPDAPDAPETNGYRRQESECADDERLIPENGSPIIDTEPAYRFDRTELKLERLSTGSRDLSTRKSIANGDLFSSLSENRKSGPKSPKSPSKMSLKNFKLSSPTKFKFPDWGTRAGSPPETAPPPPPVAPALSVEEEIELRRPCYYFEQVETIPDDVPSDRVIEVTNVSVHSLQDDYQLNVKFIKCTNWLEGDSGCYKVGKPEENELVRQIRDGDVAAVDRLIQPYCDSFALIEFVAGCQMEYKNGPVVVIDKHGDWKALTFCTLSAACGGARDPNAKDPNEQYRSSRDDCADLYCAMALAAHARCPSVAGRSVYTPAGLLAAYAALAAYGDRIRAMR